MNASLWFNKENITIEEKAAIIHLKPGSKVLSTTVLGGGLRNDITHIFNYDLKDKSGQCLLSQDTYEKELAVIGKKLGLPEKTSIGMTTAVSMSDIIIKTNSAHDLTVTTVVTAGIENNGGCAGDPHSYREENHGFVLHPGTINIILLMDCDLPDGILFRSAVTATEAKVAAIRELLLPSCFSEEPATGSGTDGLFVVSNSNSPQKRTDAGKHSLLGELIGKTVKDAVKEGLLFHMEPSLTNMRSMGSLLRRFSATKERFLLKKGATDSIWYAAQGDFSITIKAMQVTHLLDYCRWGHLTVNERNKEIASILELKTLDFNDFDIEHLWYQWLIDTSKTKEAAYE